MINGKMVKEEEEDMISELPNVLIHHILLFLDMQQVVQTSLLSKRWRYIWASNPYLNIDSFKWDNDGNFVNFVGCVLRLRDDSNIHKFCLEGLHSINRVEVDKWITSITRRNVQVVRLKFLQISQSSLNSLSRNVKTLVLDSLYFSSNLICVSSPIMENLVIRKCYCSFYGRVTITAPMLKSLVVDDTHGRRDTSCHMEISAPNLTLLHIKSYMIEYYSIEKISDLATASIDLDTFEHDEEKIARGLFSILKGVVNAESLTLGATAFETLSDVPHYLKALLHECYNLRYLKLTTWSTKSLDHIPRMLDFVMSIPHLETLVLEKIQKLAEHAWTDRLSFEGTFHYLKFVEIQNFTGSDNELNFLELLLKNAVVLEKCILKIGVLSSREKEDMFTQFYEKLPLLPKPSSSVKISLVEY